MVGIKMGPAVFRKAHEQCRSLQAGDHLGRWKILPVLYAESCLRGVKICTVREMRSPLGTKTSSFADI